VPEVGGQTESADGCVESVADGAVLVVSEPGGVDTAAGGRLEGGFERFVFDFSHPVAIGQWPMVDVEAKFNIETLDPIDPDRLEVVRIEMRHDHLPDQRQRQANLFEALFGLANAQAGVDEYDIRPMRSVVLQDEG